MDNLRKKKPNFRPARSIDGFVDSGSSRNLHATHSSPRHLEAKGSQLGDFRRPNGFHSASKVIDAKEPELIESNLIDKRQLSEELPLPKERKHKKRRNLKKIAKRSALALVLTVFITGGVLFGKGYWKLHQVFKGGGGAAALEENVDPTKLKGEGDGRINVLLLGIGGEGHEGPDLSDTILVASIDPVQKTAALLSIPRDLWVKPEGFGSMKINSVYANNKYAALSKKKTEKEAVEIGLNAVDKEISKDLGIPIHYHSLIDARGFEKAINTVGGVDINIAKAHAVYEVLWDDLSNKTYVLNVKEGNQHFDGQRATFYARSRHASARGDFDRTERQRLLMLALKDKIFSLGTFSNPLKISNLIDDFGNHISVNMTVNEMLRLYTIGKDINMIASIGLADPPNNYVTTDNVNGVSIVRPRAGLTDFSEIQNYVRNALKDGYIANENAKIMVLNGTDISGLATKKADLLKTYGYNISAVDSAPTQNYTKTVLVDMRSGAKKYTKHYLEKRLGVTAVTSLPDPAIKPLDADFVIILGSNEEATLSQ